MSQADEHVIPLIPFASMRRSGSHFCMHRTLSAIKLSGPLEFGAHLNSIGWGKFSRRTASFDPIKELSYRKQNYFYRDDQRATPLTPALVEGPAYADALYAWMIGQPDHPFLNPRGLRLAFVAINVEEMSTDQTIEGIRSLLSKTPLFRGRTGRLPLFVPLRALRSIALSRSQWLVGKESNIMAEGFRKLDASVWQDHYIASTTGETPNGYPVVGLHYGEGVRTEGQVLLDVFRPAVSRFLPVHSLVPPWVRGSVLPDARGSSFVGSGVSKESAVVDSLRDRASRLSEFAHLFRECPAAKDHADKFGEL